MSEYRGYQFRIYPTREQEVQIGKIFSAVHFTYNELLKAWMQDQSLELTSALDRLIRQYPWLEFIDRSILNNTRVSLEKACAAFRRDSGMTPAATGQRALRSAADRPGTAPAPAAGTAAPADTARPAGHPRFKTKKDSYSSFTISSANNIYLRCNRITLGGQPGLTPIRMEQSRPLPREAHICSATVSRNPSGQYHVSILCRLSRAREPISTGTAVVGLDYSLSSFFVASDPSLIPDDNCLHHWKRSREKLAQENRRLSHMVPHSRNYEKQKRRVARVHESIRCQRKDYLQKLSTEIADRYDIVCVGTLNLVEMEGYSHGYARCIQDNGWNDFVRMLAYKLRERGKTLVKVSRWFPSSRLCHECGYLYEGLRLSEREWDCPCCGAHLNRDYNASLNIRDEGLHVILRRRQGSGGYGMPLRETSCANYPVSDPGGVPCALPLSTAFGASCLQDHADSPLLDYLYEDTTDYGRYGIREDDDPGESEEEGGDFGISGWDRPFYVIPEGGSDCACICQ